MDAQELKEPEKISTRHGKGGKSVNWVTQERPSFLFCYQGSCGIKRVHNGINNEEKFYEIFKFVADKIYF